MLSIDTPTGWTVKKLGDIGEAIIGLTYSPKDVVDEGGIEVLRSSNVQEGRIALDDLVRVSAKIPQKLLLQKGDILVCARNGSRRLIGKNAYIDATNAGKTFGAFMCIYRSNNPDYMYWVFQTELFRKQIARDLGPTINQVTTGNLNSFKFAFPDGPTQQRITEILGTWDVYLRNLDKKIELKKAIKRGLIQQLLCGVGEKTHLDQLGIFTKGSGIPKDSLVNQGLPAIRYGELYTKHNVRINEVFSRITPNTAQTATPITRGDILFAGSGETIDEIGKSAVYLLSETAYAGGDIIIFRTNSKNDHTFLAYLLNAPTTRRKLRRLGQGQSVVHVYKRDLEKLTLEVPSKDEQIRIGKILCLADEEIDLLLKKKATIVKQRNYLVNNLITGKLFAHSGTEPAVKEAQNA